MIRSIMVGTDTSRAATLAVEEAAELARAHDAELLVLYVRPPVDAREMFVRSVVAARRRDGDGGASRPPVTSAAQAGPS